MISYEKSKTILKKAKIKIKEETIKSINSLNRVVSTNIYSNICLLYTSDAADDSLRVDLGGRRIIKKKIP